MNQRVMEIIILCDQTDCKYISGRAFGIAPTCTYGHPVFYSQGDKRQCVSKIKRLDETKEEK
jgi:hypothetical protein